MVNWFGTEDHFLGETFFKGLELIKPEHFGVPKICVGGLGKGKWKKKKQR